MGGKMLRLDKSRLRVTTLDDIAEERRYWLSRSAAERLNAIELNRRMVYGSDRTTPRLQRLLETPELS
jgi:hypothetical protein